MHHPLNHILSIFTKHEQVMDKFANILFAGLCNAFCPDCIGKQVKSELSPNNLDIFPLKNLDAFVDILKKELITELSFTGTTTDPLLYKHQEKLLIYLREKIPGAKISLHTNGRLIQKMQDIYNMYDRAAISLPSFDDDIYQKIMGTKHIPDLHTILALSKIPIKISVLINEHNSHDIQKFLDKAAKVGVQRIVFRKLFGETRPFEEILDMDITGLTLEKKFMNNPVYSYKQMEVTFWDFDATENMVYNLFANGNIYKGYLLTKA